MITERVKQYMWELWFISRTLPGINNKIYNKDNPQPEMKTVTRMMARDSSNRWKQWLRLFWWNQTVAMVIVLISESQNGLGHDGELTKQFKPHKFRTWQVQKDVAAVRGGWLAQFIFTVLIKQEKPVGVSYTPTQRSNGY